MPWYLDFLTRAAVVTGAKLRASARLICLFSLTGKLVGRTIATSSFLYLHAPGLQLQRLEAYCSPPDPGLTRFSACFVSPSSSSFWNSSTFDYLFPSHWRKKCFLLVRFENSNTNSDSNIPGLKMPMPITDLEKRKQISVKRNPEQKMNI